MRIDELYIRDEEIELLNLLKEGYSYDEIAKIVFKSKRTLESRGVSIKGKLAGKNMIHTVVTAIRKGIISLCFMLFSFTAFSQGDVVGQRVHYVRIGPSLFCLPFCPGYFAYRVILKVYYQPPYRICDTVIMKMYNLDDSSVTTLRKVMDSWDYVPEDQVFCLDVNQLLTYIVVSYNGTFNLKPNTKGWLATGQIGCN